MEELVKYYPNNSKSTDDTKSFDELKEGLKYLEYAGCENPYETYLITQLKIVETLPSIIKEHIMMLNVGDDIDLVLESFELEVYSVKKDIYSELTDWELLLDHMEDERISEVTYNPKGHGDLLLKELFWIRKCEDKHLMK
jgi:MerR family transcriptional regulator, copper efflux regulator